MRDSYLESLGNTVSELSWFTLQLAISQSVRLGREPLCESWPDFSWSWHLRCWCHGASSLTGGQVCLLYSILYWSLHHLTLWNHLCSTIFWSVLIWVSQSFQH